MMDNVWIVDFGSQYTQLITRKTRALGYASEIITVDECLERIKKKLRPLAFILSGGPQSVFEDQTDYSPLFNLKIPVLGICYGMQIIGQYFHGKVERGHQGEYGRAKIHLDKTKKIPAVPSDFHVWMSHFDHVSTAPKNFSVIMESENGMLAGIENVMDKILAFQFHPEVEHTEYGGDLLKYFFKDLALIKPNWSGTAMMDDCLKKVEVAKDKKVLCAFSGGVDSLVAAVLAQKILKDNLYCFFVDHGLLRPQDLIHIENLKKETTLNIEIIDAKTEFMQKLKGISDPEKKRKIIGTSFIEVFEEKVHYFEKTHNIKFEYLLQGTLYPDVIESTGHHQKGGKSVTIKSHHNVGGLPERMKLKLLEPLRFLFKDEVRELGRDLNLKIDSVNRHPFPGPGIGVRVLGELSEEKVLQVQKSDQILFEELHRFNLYKACWQAFTVLLPVNTVGVKGDARAYEQVICLRIVNSTDGMTAHWTNMPYDFLDHVSRRITNEVSGITRVVYDITSKPPATIEWE